MKNIIASALLGVLLASVSGCTSLRNILVSDTLEKTKHGDDPKKVEAFEDKFTKVLDDVENKDDYKKLPLDGADDTKWLIRQSFLLWDKQQTKEQYINEGLKKYPAYKGTLEYLANEFAK